MFGAQHLLGRLVTVFPLSHKPDNHLISHRVGSLPLPGAELPADSDASPLSPNPQT
jgi:hypothetical protein